MANIDMKSSKTLRENEIDQIVTEHADDDSQWEEPIEVKGIKEFSLAIPFELAQKAAFFARLHKQSSVADWFRQIIEERLDSEETAFDEIKSDLIAKVSK